MISKYVVVVALSPSFVHERSSFAGGGLGFVFQLMLQVHVAMPSSPDVFGSRSFDVEIVPLGSVSVIVQ